ncbi:hypothetical protein FQR65_LT16209 [Abscondita terminalis]|nr:hypothetical protein FQR65_LT16209 [Abscondita terminalis]
MSSTIKKSTVSEEECEYFNSISSIWWNNPKLFCLQKLCELFSPYMCSIIKETFPDKPLSSLRVLEVGCGGGFLSEALARAGCNLVAIDVVEELLDIAKSHSKSNPSVPKITYLLESIEDHCNKNYQEYDVVISNFVLEHVADHHYFIKCCSNCVKPKGLLFMSALPKTLICRFMGIFMAEKILRVIPKGMHDYEKCIKASDAERIIRSNNFEIKRTRGAICNPFTYSAYFFPSTKLYYIICANELYDQTWCLLTPNEKKRMRCRKDERDKLEGFTEDEFFEMH